MAIGHKVAAALAAKDAKEQDDMADVKPQTEDVSALKAQLEALQAQIAVLASAQPGTKALELLAERSAPRQNPNFNQRSVFTYPEGERVRPKPKLLRPTFFCGAKQRETQLTPSEIELFNKFDRSKVAHGGRWTAELRQNGSAQELHIQVPAKSVDDRMSLPSLAVILTELLHGEGAADPTRLAERVAELEAKLAAANAA